jgi:hypothetical protein
MALRRKQRTNFGRGGQNDGHVEDLTESSVGEEVVAVDDGVEVVNKLVKANLVINNEEQLDTCQ